MISPDFDETVLEKFGPPVVVEPEQHHTARATDTSVVMGDVMSEEFQRYRQAGKN